MASSHSIELAVAKLAESGLTPEHAKALHLDVLDAKETAASGISWAECPSLLFNYMDPWRPGQPLRPRPKHPAFKRVRHLGPSLPLNGDNKPIRYAQAPGSGVCAYFPTLIDWAAIKADTNRGVLITEGELKSAKACAEGFACIGLGGVSNFVGTGMGIGFLPELEGMDWVGRRVYIVYDNDGMPKPDPMAAINRLAQELEQRGAIPYTVTLPLLAGAKKTGLDDFLVAEGHVKLRTLLEHAESLTLAQPLWEMNKQVSLVRNPMLVVEHATGRLIKPRDFTDVLHANTLVPEQKVMPDGSISMKKVPVGAAWLKWAMRSECSGITYAPGQPQIVDGKWNQWKGWKATPVKGDVGPWLTLIDFLFSNASKEAKEWFMRWCAFPIQNPGSKHYTAVVLHSNMSGTGKSLVGYTLGEIYGENFIEVKQKQLFGKFNGWAANRQFVLGDDLTGSEKREVADMLKHMITCQTNTIDEKYLVPYTVPDCVNYLLTSNQPDGFYVEDTDRRLFIHNVPETPMEHSWYANVYDPWYKSAAGRNALMYYLLHLPMGDFDHRARALVTESKKAMIDMGRSDIGTWCQKLKTNPELILLVGKVKLKRDVYTSEELRNIYDPTGQHKVTANAMARNLKQIGFPLVYDGMPVPVPGKPTGRYFAVRNEQHWAKAKLKDVRNHIENADK